MPTLTPGSGQFPRSKGRIIGSNIFFSDLRLAYHVLNLSMAIQTYFAVKAIFKRRSLKGLRMFVVGGFARNRLYLKLLATIFRDAEVLRAGYTDLTSLGAAITAKAAYEDVSPCDIDRELIESIIAERRVKPIDVEENLLMEYIDEFEHHCQSEKW